MLACRIRGSPTQGYIAGEAFAFPSSVDAATKARVDDSYIGREAWIRVVSPDQDLDDAIELSCVIAKLTPPYVTHLPV